jgi:hypothetical protein
MKRDSCALPAVALTGSPPLISELVPIASSGNLLGGDLESKPL